MFTPKGFDEVRGLFPPFVLDALDLRASEGLELACLESGIIVPLLRPVALLVAPRIRPVPACNTVM